MKALKQLAAKHGLKTEGEFEICINQGCTSLGWTDSAENAIAFAKDAAKILASVNYPFISVLSKTNDRFFKSFKLRGK